MQGFFVRSVAAYPCRRASPRWCCRQSTAGASPENRGTKQKGPAVAPMAGPLNAIDERDLGSAPVLIWSVAIISGRGPCLNARNTRPDNHACRKVRPTAVAIKIGTALVDAITVSAMAKTPCLGTRCANGSDFFSVTGNGSSRREVACLVWRRNRHADRWLAVAHRDSDPDHPLGLVLLPARSVEGRTPGEPAGVWSRWNASSHTLPIRRSDRALNEETRLGVSRAGTGAHVVVPDRR